MAEVPAAAKKWQPRMILAVVLGVGAALGAMALAAWGLFLGFERPVRPEDRAVFVTFELLSEKVAGLKKTPDSEETARKLFLDGSYEVSYSYEDDYLKLDSSVNHERSVRDATQLFMMTETALPMATKLTKEDVDFVPRNDLFSGGDERYCAAISSGGTALGHVLLVREGQNVFTLTIGGAFLGDPSEFQALVEPRLDAMKRLP